MRRIAVAAVVAALALTGCSNPAPVATPQSFAAQRTAAVRNYLAYARSEVTQLVSGTAAFVTAWQGGDDATAKQLFPVARSHYESIEPLAKLFTALDTSIDVRKLDLSPVAPWTGWHRIEEDLWAPATGYTPLDTAGRIALGDRLNDDTVQLAALLDDPGFALTLSEVSTGAIALLDEVATSKITGEEDVWSHTDLWDFQSNVNGAREAYEDVRGIALEKGATGRSLVKQIDRDFAVIDATLAGYGTIDTGFVPYDSLTVSQVRQLSNQVNALAEPLSKLTAVVLQ